MVTPGQSWEWETVRTGLFPGPCACISCTSLKAGAPKVKSKLRLTCSTHWGRGMHVQGLGVDGAAVWLLTMLLTSQSQAPDAPLIMQIC